jgi:hypothetical protein
MVTRLKTRAWRLMLPLERKVPRFLLPPCRLARNQPELSTFLLVQS